MNITIFSPEVSPENDEKAEQKWLADTYNEMVYSTPCKVCGTYFHTKEEACSALANFFKQRFKRAFRKYMELKAEEVKTRIKRILEWRNRK